MSEVADNSTSKKAMAAAATYIRTADTSTRPKSKKELRAEKKAAQKAAATGGREPTKEEKAAEKHRIKKERRKQQLKEREKAFQKEKKERQKKRKARELHSVGGGLDPVLAAKRLEEKKQKKKQKKEQKVAAEESNFFSDMKVFDKVFNGTGEEDEEGVRTLELGVKCRDVVIGKGPTVENNSLVTVMYKLKSGKGILIDSSKKFVFRVGKGNVIRGWDIGVVGMAVGGTRKLIVPPKAGYQGQDIGAGPGALLYFDITVLSCT